jgi:hypothetical protein
MGEYKKTFIFIGKQGAVNDSFGHAADLQSVAVRKLGLSH